MDKRDNVYSAAKISLTPNNVIIKTYKIPYQLGEKRKNLNNLQKIKPENFEKRQDNLFRAQSTIKGIIDANLTPHTKFLTLTTSDTVLDENVFRKRFSAFLKAMKRENFNLRYLYVLERQKQRGIKEGNEGSIHAHIIIFNDEYIPFEIINKHWRGNTDIHILDGLKYDNKEQINDVASYVCKYVTKDNLNDFNKRFFCCSKGLSRPYQFNLPVYKIDDNTYFADKSEQIYNDYNIIVNNLSFYRKDTLYAPLPFDRTKIQKTEIKYGRFK